MLIMLIMLTIKKSDIKKSRYRKIPVLKNLINKNPCIKTSLYFKNSGINDNDVFKNPDLTNS